MRRSLPSLPLLLVTAGLSATLAGCSGHDEAAQVPVPDASASASAPQAAAPMAPASGPVDASAAPMDSISSASAVAMSESASNVAAQAQDAQPVAVSQASAPARLSNDDEKFVKDVTQADLYAVQASGLAGDHALSADLKAFAAKVAVDDAAASADLATLASARGVKLPDAIALTRKAQFALLEHLQAKNFDQRYIQDVGIDDHRNAIVLLERENMRTRDADLKAWIARTLPTWREHYAVAQQIARTIKG